MKRITAIFLIFAMLCLMFSGCGEEEKEPYVPTGSALEYEGEEYLEEEEDDGLSQSFSLAYYEKRSLNPMVSTDFTNRTLFSLIYQGLFSVDRNYEAVPILCKSFQTSANNKTYTFYLEDATFSDGTAVTVEDVLATYAAAEESSYYGGRFTHILEIVPSDDGGITFNLSTPYENLPLLLDIPILKASEIEAERPLGTGPYILLDRLGGTSLHRRTDWWCKADMEVTAATIPLVAATSASGIRDEFEFGDVGLVCADPCTYNYADFRSDFELWDCDNGYFLFLAFNVSYSEDELFEDQRLRAAFTYAIDRAMLSEDIFRGYARPTTIAADPNSPYFSASLSAKYEYDSMKFMGILENYYITRPIKLLVNSDDRLRLQTAREIARMLTEQGLVTETLEKASKEFNSAITRGDYDLYLGRTKLSANMDLSCFFHGNGSMRRNGVADPETYQLCVNALANHGNYYNLHQKVAEDARIVPLLFYGYSIYAERGLLSDLEPSRDNVFFYSLNKTMESIRIPTDYS